MILTADTISDTMTVKSLLKEAQEILEPAGVETARLDSEILLCEVLDCSREEVIARPDQTLNLEQQLKFRGWVVRREKREPIAYILGRKEFWSLDFQVNPAVLIPRPDTECLVQHFLDSVRSSPVNAPRILDMGTGSGILAVVAALEIPEAHLVAMDSSMDALQVAMDNAKNHKVKDRIYFVHGDFSKKFWEGEPFDFILSNPPYIDSAALRTLAPEIVNHEPLHALDGGNNGLDAYRGLLPEALRLLKPGGHLVLEIGDAQGDDVSNLILDSGGFETPQRICDYSGHERVLSAQRKTDG